MTLNTFADNEALWAGRLNALANAPGSELVENGCTPSKGTNDWDVDIASGDVRVDGSGTVSVSAQTVNLADPTSDMASGEERIVIVHINNSGTASATEGTAASSNPVTPDIPSSEVLVALVHVENADSTIADSDLFDTRIVVNDGTDSGVNADVVRGEVPFSDTDDGSDVTVYSGTGTIVDITGSGVLLGGVSIRGETNQAGSAEFTITVDGGTSYSTGYVSDEAATTGHFFSAAAVPVVKFESSLTVACDADGMVFVRQ